MKKYAAHTTGGRVATHKNAFVNRKATRKCGGCGQPSKHLGAASGTCPRCQNAAVADLERSMGMKPGELGRVNSRGEVKE